MQVTHSCMFTGHAMPTKKMKVPTYLMRPTPSWPQPRGRSCPRPPVCPQSHIHDYMRSTACPRPNAHEGLPTPCATSRLGELSSSMLSTI